MTKQFLRNTTTVLSLIFLVSCSNTSNDDTRQRSVLNVYNWADYIDLNTLEQFEDEFGIKVNYDVYDASAIVDVKLLTGNSGYDVVVHSNQFASRLIDIGVFQKLDTERLPNLVNLDAETMQAIDIYEQVRGYNVPYHWGSTGIAWNVDMIQERLPGYEIDSAAVLFDPDIVSKLADCGVSFLDGTTSTIPMALAYFGLEPNAVDEHTLSQLEVHLKKVRPYVRYFSNDKFLFDLPNRELCIAMTWSGDYASSARRAREAGLDIELRYIVPKEGAALWVDGLYIPADAPNPDAAHKFLNFLLRADIAAAIARDTDYANANAASWKYLDEDMLNNPAIYPDAADWDRLFPVESVDPVRERARTRALARIKSGI